MCNYYSSPPSLPNHPKPHKPLNCLNRLLINPPAHFANRARVPTHASRPCISAESGTNLAPLVRRTRALLDALDARAEAKAEQVEQQKRSAPAAAQAARRAGVPVDAKPVDAPAS